MVCHEGMHLAEEFLVFDVRYSQPCISKDSILFGAKQNFDCLCNIEQVFGLVGWKIKWYPL